MSDGPRGAGATEKSVRPLEIVIIVAVADNGVIGNHGTLPWRLKSDMRHFRALTVGKPVVMGRKTYESLSVKPLPGRTNIVVSRDRAFAAPGVVVAASLDRALSLARADASRGAAGMVMVIGGEEIYAQALRLADRLELTRVHASPPGDTFFPSINPREWNEMARVDHAAGIGDDASFTTISYRRIR